MTHSLSRKARMLVCVMVLAAFVCTDLSSREQRPVGSVDLPVLPADLSAERDAGPAFEPLYLFYGTKLGLSLLLAGTAMTAPDVSGMERAAAGGASLLVGIPSAAVLYNARRGDADAVRTWRIVSFAADFSVAAGLTGYGIYLAGGDIGDQYAGLAAGTVGLLGVLTSFLDLKPFRFER